MEVLIPVILKLGSSKSQSFSCLKVVDDSTVITQCRLSLIKIVYFVRFVRQTVFGVDVFDVSIAIMASFRLRQVFARNNVVM